MIIKIFVIFKYNNKLINKTLLHTAVPKSNNIIVNLLLKAGSNVSYIIPDVLHVIAYK